MNESDVIVPPEAIFKLYGRIVLVRCSMYMGNYRI